MNFLEQLGTVVVLTLVSGFEYPVVTSIVTAMYGVARILFMLPNRGPGLVVGNFCISLLAIGAFYSSIKLIVDVASM